MQMQAGRGMEDRGVSPLERPGSCATTEQTDNIRPSALLRRELIRVCLDWQGYSGGGFHYRSDHSRWVLF